MNHVEIFRRPGRYAGWPANNGIWSWRGGGRRDEIVVSFNAAYMKMTTPGLHPIDREKTRRVMLARSLDGGASWDVAPAAIVMPSKTELGKADMSVIGACPGGIDFSHPDFALMCQRDGDGDACVSWFYVSNDRCRTWDGPYRLPMFGRRGIAARTDYEARDEQECLLFLTAMKADGREGRPFCARTYDGGASWNFIAWIGPEPDGFSIMPASVRLADDTLLVAVRRQENPDDNFIALYGSENDGESWELVNPRLVDCGGHGGNPPALVRRRGDADRLVLTYGYRSEPYGIRAVTSDDGGKTWGEPIILRADAGGPDLGYSRTVEREDGKIVTVYYYNDPSQPERYIACTIWDADGLP